MTYQKTLVPLDGSEIAETALSYAGRIAQKCNGEVSLVTIVGPHCDAKTRNLCKAYLNLKQAELESWGLEVTAEVVTGDIPDTIVDYGAEIGCDLIVISSYCYSGLKRLTFGNHARRSVHDVCIPVIMVKGVPEELENGSLKKVLLPLDGSYFSETSVQFVEKLATESDIEVILLAVREPPVVLSDRSPDIKPSWEEYCAALIQEVEQQAMTYLDRVKKSLEEKGIKTRSRFVLGKVVEGIMQVAEEEHVDLIAMATHGRAGVSRWVYGSVTSRVMDSSRQPVLVVRPCS